MVDQKQINREKDYSHECYDRRILNFLGRGPRDAFHFRPHITQKLRHATDWSHPGSAETPLATRPFALDTLAEAGSAWRGKRRVWVFYVIHDLADLFDTRILPICLIPALSYTSLAGVPGFEPGLSVLETDVLT